MKKLIFNRFDLKSRRRSLRRNQTDTERKLWGKLRNKNLFGYKFFRQYSIGPYILDFYSPSARLGIELNGSQHVEMRKSYDEKRLRYLKNFNITILRFWDNEVLKNIEGVMLKIIEELKFSNLHRSPSNPS